MGVLAYELVVGRPPFGMVRRGVAVNGVKGTERCGVPGWLSDWWIRGEATTGRGLPHALQSFRVGGARRPGPCKCWA